MLFIDDVLTKVDADDDDPVENELIDLGATQKF
jgi:hypothetical protein